MTDFYPRGDHSAVEQAFANVDPNLADILLTNRPSVSRRTRGAHARTAGTPP